MKKIKTLLAAFLVLIAAGMLIACSSNSDAPSLDTSSNATPLFAAEDATIPADDVDLSNGHWVFKWVYTRENSSTSLWFEDNHIDYNYISAETVIVLNFSVSNGKRSTASGTYKDVAVLDNDNKAKLQTFLNENGLTRKWEGNKAIAEQNDYTYDGNMTSALQSASESYVTVTTNENKTLYIISFSNNDKYYFAKL